jgi:hypothetical protein
MMWKEGEKGQKQEISSPSKLGALFIRMDGWIHGRIVERKYFTMGFQFPS